MGNAEMVTPEAPAMASRPRITVKVRIKISATRYREEERTRFADVLLIDKLHYSGQICDRQSAAAWRLFQLCSAGGLLRPTTARYDVTPEQAMEYAEDDEGEIDDDPDLGARDEYNAVLRDAGAVRAELLAALCHGQNPGTWRLAATQQALDWLADFWGIEKSP